MRRRLAFCLLFAVFASACHRRHARIVFTRREGDRDRLYIAEPSGTHAPIPSLPRVPGDVYSGASIDGGRGLLVVVRFSSSATRGELWRLAADRNGLHAVRRLAEGPLLNLSGASHDGRAALLFDNEANHNHYYVYREGRADPLTPMGEFRYIAGADISADGRRALVSGTPLDCTDRYLGRCPLVTYGVDLTTDTPSYHPIAVSLRANYQPRFVPNTSGERVLYQTTEFDSSPECAADLNHCRHDLVTRDWAARELPQMMRTGAVGPAYSPGATRLAYLVYGDPAAGCQALPCPHQSLFVTLVGREEPRRVAAGEVAIFVQRYWSADDRWLAYHSEDRTTHARTIKTVDVDGRPGRTLGDGRVIGWIMQ